MFPDVCNFCQKNQVQYRGKKIFPITIATKQAEETLKKRALDRDQTLYFKIKEEDLIAKEFKYHRHCYQSFTRPSYQARAEVYEKKDFEVVRSIIDKEVIGNGKLIPLNNLYEAYGLEGSDRKAKYYLRQQIQSKFENKLVLLTDKEGSGKDYVISKESLGSDSNVKDNIVKKAANIVREQILEYSKSLTPLQWPPTVEQLASEERKPPCSTQLFFRTALGSADNSRLVDSFSQDLVSGVGKILTEKQFLMALGLHNMTGQRNVVEVLNRFGNCMTYKQTCEILTANAESAIQKSKMTSLLPILPEGPLEIVRTFFWVDNFDLLTDARYGGGSINITTMMAFQEGKVQNNRLHIPVPRKADRQLSNEEHQILEGNFNPQVALPEIINVKSAQFCFNDKEYLTIYFIWIIARRENVVNQTIPTLSGYQLQKRLSNGEEIQKTNETYLPPINSKVCFNSKF